MRKKLLALIELHGMEKMIMVYHKFLESIFVV